MNGYLIYHRRRVLKQFSNDKVYCDATSGNQDPYVWNIRFLHTYCHMTELSPKPTIGDYIFWIFGDTFPDFSKLYCDLVFVVQSKCYWQSPNKIDEHDPIVDSSEAFTDHYLWGCGYEHCYKPDNKRFTLKADPSCSFQPQNADGRLLHIVEVLESHGYPLATLRNKLIKTRKTENPGSHPQSKPLCLDDAVTRALYNWLQQASIKLTGDKLEKIRKDHLWLASRPPSKPPKCS